MGHIAFLFALILPHDSPIFHRISNFTNFPEEQHTENSLYFELEWPPVAPWHRPISLIGPMM
jgi:hypothetical protein